MDTSCLPYRAVHATHRHASWRRLTSCLCCCPGRRRGQGARLSPSNQTARCAHARACALRSFYMGRAQILCLRFASCLRGGQHGARACRCTSVNWNGSYCSGSSAPEARESSSAYRLQVWLTREHGTCVCVTQLPLPLSTHRATSTLNAAPARLQRARVVPYRAQWGRTHRQHTTMHTQRLGLSRAYRSNQSLFPFHYPAGTAVPQEQATTAGKPRLPSAGLRRAARGGAGGDRNGWVG